MISLTNGSWIHLNFVEIMAKKLDLTDVKKFAGAVFYREQAIDYTEPHS